MNWRNLLRELIVAEHIVTAKQRSWFASMGINEDVMSRSGPLGRVRLMPNDPEPGLYTPTDCDRGDDGAVEAVVHAVLSRPLNSRLSGFDNFVDLVAWDPKRPDKWWLRMGGVATWIGAGAIMDAASEDWDEWLYGHPQPGLTLHQTPLDWLKAGARNDGAVVLQDGRRLWRDIFQGVKKITVADTAFADVVYKKIKKRPPTAKLPEVWLDEKIKDEAAA